VYGIDAHGSNVGQQYGEWLERRPTIIVPIHRPAPVLALGLMKNQVDPLSHA